ncbi:MAG: hypothetical protein MJE63_31105 [Proteobacteria bacterium]|nr:hypothetical protein [Pseudomonadota bacterium]
MDEQDIYTITIVRNIGVPISFTIKRWKVMFLMGFFALLSLSLLVGSVDYFFLRLKSEQLTNQLSENVKKSDLLSEQIARLDHDRYWVNSAEKTKEITKTKEEITDQPEFSTEGIWITSRPTLDEEDFQEGRFVEVDTFRSSVKGDLLRMTVKLKNTSNPAQVVGGYICITLVNNDQSPTLYQSVTEGSVSENGFPSSYKSGKNYYIKRKTSTSRLNFKLTKVNEYYTDAMVFLYSWQGTLLNRSQYVLDKEIFLE